MTHYPVSPSLLWQIRKAAYDMDTAVAPVRDVFNQRGYTDDHERLAAVVTQLQAAWDNLIDQLACVLYEAAVEQQLTDDAAAMFGEQWEAIKAEPYGRHGLPDDDDEAAGVTYASDDGRFTATVKTVESGRPYGVGENGEP